MLGKYRLAPEIGVRAALSVRAPNVQYYTDFLEQLEGQKAGASKITKFLQIIPLKGSAMDQLPPVRLDFGLGF